MAPGCVKGKQWAVQAVWHGPGSQVLGTPGGETGSPGRDGSAAGGGRGTREMGGIRCLPVAVGYFWTGVALFLRPPSLRGGGTHVCVFADHLLGAPPAQLSLQSLSLHVTGLSLFEASSNTWRVGDLLSH